MPPPEKRPSPLSQRRVKSYDETAAEMQGQGHGRDYDRHRITQFIRQPFSTSATDEDDGLRRVLNERDMGGDGGLGVNVVSVTSGPEKLLTRARTSLPVNIRYNDTGSFEEVDEDKVFADVSFAIFQCNSLPTLH